MPTINGILETALYVADLERAKSFYQEVFGFPAIFEHERLVAMAVCERQVLLLFLRGASANLPVSAHDGGGESHLAFAVSATELSDWQAWLKEKAIPIEEDHAWDRGGRSLYFRDPDRQLLEVGSPGIWSNY